MGIKLGYGKLLEKVEIFFNSRVVFSVGNERRAKF